MNIHVVAVLPVANTFAIYERDITLPFIPDAGMPLVFDLPNGAARWPIKEVDWSVNASRLCAYLDLTGTHSPESLQQCGFTLAA